MLKNKKIYKPEKVFLVLATLFIGITIFIMPINRVPDETTHARNAWSILYEKGGFDWFSSVSTDTDVDQQEYKKIFTQKVDFSEEKFHFDLNLKKTVFIPQMIGMMIGKAVYPSIGVIITLGRILNAIVYLISMYFVIKIMKYGKEALTFIALLPIMIQQASSLSYDTANFIAITGFFSLVTNLSVNKIVTKKYLIWICLFLLLLLITKKNNLILLFLLLLLNLRLPKRYIKINNGIDKIDNWISKQYKLLTIIVTCFCFFAMIFYLKEKGGITNFSQVMINTLLNNNLNGHLNTILTIGIFGFLGNFHAQFPLWLIFLDIITITLLMTKKTTIKLNKAFGVVSGGMFPLHILAIVAGMYFAWTPIILGDNALISVGAQGRYFTPFLIYFVPFFISFSSYFHSYVDKKFSKKIIVLLSLVNFLTMIYLICMSYWFVEYQSDWLIHIRTIFGQ